MTPENWPEPIGRVEELHSLDAVHIHVEPMPDVGETIYTATQVREIVRMEVEQLKLDADEMVRQMLDAMTDMLPLPDLSDSYAEAIRDARKWLKENKDAD